ncbi:MAG: reductive dehalogenase domain-containing protein [Gemmatimonadales bacterium]|jgi:reductive dehalogenase
MLIDIATLTIGCLLALGFLYASYVSVQEREARAARLALLGAVVLPAPFLLVALGTLPGKALIGALLVSVTAVTAVALLWPTDTRSPPENDPPCSRIDERDIMFSRRLLQPGTERFEEYYAANPEKKRLDDLFRAKPGLLRKGSSAYDPHLFAASEASFWTIERLRPFVDGEPAPERLKVDPEPTTTFIKEWGRKLGAVSVGVTALRDYHLYSVVGRGDDYGQPVTLDHGFAVAFTVEMDKRMLDCAPLSPTVMESAQQYVAAGVIATQLAQYIRSIGYPARAHIDGNYRVVCPLVARDAGLGEIGRMGLLMTPRLGPRVRIGVVTTDLPLVPDDPRRDRTVIDFCERCRKCASVCPASAIPSGDREEVDGVRRWQIDSEACFTFWCHVGTDCARCVAACPYSHPDNLLHRAVRRGVRNSALFRRAAIAGDDLVYGKNPAPSPLPDWMAGVANREG